MAEACKVCSLTESYPENRLIQCHGNQCDVIVHQALKSTHDDHQPVARPCHLVKANRAYHIMGLLAFIESTRYDHQPVGCYGVAQAPTNDWYCDRCKAKETNPIIKCQLCPSEDGAFKICSNGAWAHVICALYIPEVTFGNNQTMEPIEISTIQGDRYRKICYLCQLKGQLSGALMGACIKCSQPTCSSYFHVTCAQSEDLLWELSSKDLSKYCGFCHKHHPNQLKMKKDTKKRKRKPSQSSKTENLVLHWNADSADKKSATNSSSTAKDTDLNSKCKDTQGKIISLFKTSKVVYAYIGQKLAKYNDKNDPKKKKEKVSNKSYKSKKGSLNEETQSVQKNFTNENADTRIKKHHRNQQQLTAQNDLDLIASSLVNAALVMPTTSATSLDGNLSQSSGSNFYPTQNNISSLQDILIASLKNSLAFIDQTAQNHDISSYIRDIAKLRVKTRQLTEQKHQLELRRAELLLQNRDLESALQEIRKSRLCEQSVHMQNSNNDETSHRGDENVIPEISNDLRNNDSSINTIAKTSDDFYNNDTSSMPSLINPNNDLRLNNQHPSINYNLSKPDVDSNVMELSNNPINMEHVDTQDNAEALVDSSECCSKQASVNSTEDTTESIQRSNPDDHPTEKNLNLQGTLGTNVCHSHELFTHQLQAANSESPNKLTNNNSQILNGSPTYNQNGQQLLPNFNSSNNHQQQIHQIAQQTNQTLAAPSFTNILYPNHNFGVSPNIFSLHNSPSYTYPTANQHYHHHHHHDDRLLHQFEHTSNVKPVSFSQ
ncbi:uncharacterized protein TRIADDRAFT_55039 [Trichoplax adhaerens]|uniref:PHD-type domain-containing protein n=1 Tax=Trichoplax adhaerens TaxID=10228 RepID=B3RQM3_TRIAD|nr:hypothetical protein TRIADDRAFT_55039 [Trichoplax adhaerens]EDV27274.1 hypothetical protein TRIADDRAFT_55039 [Trichoplax adhaerens]|eukprot:XP_002111270.1 hypothetical protein TRIADDRAFT_55039 [Trichoplax adhaerens]